MDGVTTEEVNAFLEHYIPMLQSQDAFASKYLRLHQQNNNPGSLPSDRRIWHEFRALISQALPGEEELLFHRLMDWASESATNSSLSNSRIQNILFGQCFLPDTPLCNTLQELYLANRKKRQPQRFGNLQ